MVKRIWIALVIIAMLLVGCGAKAANEAAPQAPESYDYANGMSTSADVAPSFSEDSKAYGDEAGGGYTSGGAGEAATTERLVIKNASLTIVVEDPLDAQAKIINMAESMGGFVVSSYTYKTSLAEGGEAPEASLTVRVPAENLTQALDQIKALVKNAETDVLNENISGQDVTADYTDLKSRLTNLQDAEAQLREIMGSATKTEDVLSVFNQLTYVREQIEVIQGQMQYYEESASLSAISVQIRAEVAVQPLTIGTWQPEGIAKEAINALLGTLRFLASAVIWLIIYVLPVALLIFIPLRLLWVGLRRLRARRNGRNLSTPPAAS